MKSGNQSQADTCQRGNFSTPCAAHTMEFDHRSGQTRPHAFSTISWITFVQLHHPPTHDEDEVQFFPLRNFSKERTKNFYAFFLSFSFFFFFSYLKIQVERKETTRSLFSPREHEGTDTRNTCSQPCACVGIRDPLTE